VSDQQTQPRFRTNAQSALDFKAYEPLLNDSEAARFLGGVHPKTVQRMARRGEVPHYRVGKYYRYRASELDAWLQSQVHSASQNQNPPAQNRKEIM
jgi:excisionase family DNA binding protein